MFAQRYIAKNIVYPPFTNESPNDKLDVVVVIPSFNEPDVLSTLKSLWKCQSENVFTEVIVLINEPEESSPDISKLNQNTYDLLKEWKQKNDLDHIKLFPILAPPFRKKYAGAGMARKTGMDEAIRRFAKLDKPYGIIVSLDADTILESNYLTAIKDYFSKHPEKAAATIRFKHQITDLNKEQKKGITLYEKFLNYYRLAHEYIGYPFPIHTIGSAFAVKAEAYVKLGGMNRRTAGEDFYFLHKLTALGKIEEIDQTCVYPSARVSDRVPFGTGAAMTKWMNGDEEIMTKTYCVQSFCDLKTFFDCIDSFFQKESSIIPRLIDHLPESIKQFLAANEFIVRLEEINANSSTLKNFRKRFFQVFDAFRILKFLNWSHENFYSKQFINDAYNELQNKMSLK